MWLVFKTKTLQPPNHLRDAHFVSWRINEYNLYAFSVSYFVSLFSLPQWHPPNLRRVTFVYSERNCFFLLLFELHIQLFLRGEACHNWELCALIHVAWISKSSAWHKKQKTKDFSLHLLNTSDRIESPSHPGSSVLFSGHNTQLKLSPDSGHTWVPSRSPCEQLSCSHLHLSPKFEEWYLTPWSRTPYESG